MTLTNFLLQPNIGKWRDTAILVADDEFKNTSNQACEIKHTINDRKVFAEGALKIAKWFYQKPKKLYHMQTFVEELNGKK